MTAKFLLRSIRNMSASIAKAVVALLAATETPHLALDDWSQYSDTVVSDSHLCPIKRSQYKAKLLTFNELVLSSPRQ